MFRPNLVVDVVDASTFSVASGTAEGVDGGSIVILYKWFLFVTPPAVPFIESRYTLPLVNMCCGGGHVVAQLAHD